MDLPTMPLPGDPTKRTSTAPSDKLPLATRFFQPAMIRPSSVAAAAIAAATIALSAGLPIGAMLADKRGLAPPESEAVVALARAGYVRWMSSCAHRAEPDENDDRVRERCSDSFIEALSHTRDSVQR